MKAYLKPFILLSACFFAENVWVTLFPQLVFSDSYLYIPHFIVVCIVLSASYYDKSITYGFSAFFGLLFDLFYTQVIGVYLFTFFIAAYFTVKVMKVLQHHLVVIGFVACLMVGIVDISAYFLDGLLFGFSMQIEEYAQIRLWSTIVINLCFYIVVCYPFRRWFVITKRQFIEETGRR